MVRRNIKSITAAIVISLCGVVAAFAQMPPYSFMPAAPGEIAQSESVAFNGDGANDRWDAVVSKKYLGKGNGRKFYQWYLSIYSLRRGAYRLRYESPGNGGPLSRVTQANGAKMWFPVQEVKLVGAAPLMQKRVQLLVVQSHEMAADCGSATVTIFGTKPGSTVGPIAMVTNPCDLAAKIGADGASLELTGPYYGHNAPLCCPTKPNVTETLRYVNGKWVQSTNYFRVQ
jgi:hypothetical protein